MKLSTNFVKEYIDYDANVYELAEAMTSVGNEYDSASPLINATNLVIGEVKTSKMHPDSDHLHVCSVDVGNEELQIVCGAPNCRAGIKVIVALPGAKLPGGEIKKGKIRGVESNGMLCSIAELGLESKFLKEEDSAGIHEVSSDAVIGSDAIKALGYDDEVIDFDLTSNRGDLLSILGMAYEIGAIYGTKVKDIDLSFKENKDNINDIFKVEVQTPSCPLFLAKKALNVTIKESPDFIKQRLISSGIRPINNVVDISNYVMLETGQPIHFYDADLLGDTLIVRDAKNNEELTTLDGQRRILNENDIVISNKTNAVGLAGVMGGLETEIVDSTKNILIETAIFESVRIRKTSKKVLRSEASNRYEKGLDPKRTYMAIKRCCHLLEKYADAKIMGGMVEYKNISLDDKQIAITVSNINKILGVLLKQEEIVDIFHKLAFEVDVKKDHLLVTVPTRRTDISIKEDLIEEVGRIYGIDKIKGKKLDLVVKEGSYNKTKRAIRNKMVDLGLSETLSYTLIPFDEIKKYTTDEFEPVKLLDPMSEDRNTLRYSLIPSLKLTYDYNKARNIKDICIFEIGAGFGRVNGNYIEENKLACLMSGTYVNGLVKENVDFYVIKGVMEEILEYLGYANRYSLKITDIPNELHPGQSASIILNNQKIGIIGKIHPSITHDDIYVLEINLDKMLTFKTSGMSYKDISKYPSSNKDVAFIVKKDVTVDVLMNQIKKSGGKLLTSIEVFDVYEGENVGDLEKSIAFSLTFADPNKTLSDEEVTKAFEKIIEDVETKLNAKLRSK